MILKITEKFFGENAFQQKKKKPRVKFNPALSANRPSNNWAQNFCSKTVKVSFIFRVA